MMPDTSLTSRYVHILAPVALCGQRDADPEVNLLGKRVLLTCEMKLRSPPSFEAVIDVLRVHLVRSDLCFSSVRVV
jgi:hypothetical protein